MAKRRRIALDRVPPPEEGHSPSAFDAEIRQRLLDLALDARSYLRQNTRPAVRVSAALLLAASLAACSGDVSSSQSPPPTVAPLTQEVREGLPTAPGRYDVIESSLQRDTQGVYAFRWLDPGDTTGSGHQARVSLLKLAQSNSNYLEVPAQGDPTLYLRPNTSIQLGNTTNPAGVPGGGFGYWRPFFVGGPFLPGYYNPPQSTIPSSGTVDGARVSSSPPSPSARTVGVAGAVSGRAGGAGSGTAASTKAGAPTGSGSSIGAPKSGGFSLGGGGAASAKAGAASS